MSLPQPPATPQRRLLSASTSHGGGAGLLAQLRPRQAAQLFSQGVRTGQARLVRLILATPRMSAHLLDWLNQQRCAEKLRAPMKRCSLNALLAACVRRGQAAVLREVLAAVATWRGETPDR